MNLEELQKMLTSAIQPDFRGQLLARGQARSIIWRDGILPDDAPNFAETLNYDLLSYGVSLLSLSMRLIEKEGDKILAQRAFNQAGESIEAIVAKGDPYEQNRDFWRLLSASAFHLGRSSARAYSMLIGSIQNAKLSQIENALALLILRSLDQLEEEIVKWKIEESGSDAHLLNLINSIDENSIENESEEKLDTLDIAIDKALTDTYYTGIGYFMSALQTGQSQFVESAKIEFKTGMESCSELNLVSYWWCFRLTSHIIDDLWSSSFHRVLPKNLPGGDHPEWEELRDLYISTMYCRKRSEIELWPSQLEAAKRSTDITDDLVVSLPTSAGKTRVAELCILRCLAEGKRIMFVTPLRALSAQTEVSLQRTFGPLGKRISTLYGSIGLSKNDGDTLRNREIVVSTPEKLDFAVRNDPTLINNVGLVVLDEGHMIGLGKREVQYEIQIQRLLNREDANQRRIVCLSAVFPEANELNDLVNWLRRDKNGKAVKSDWKPTRSHFGEVTWRGNYARLDLQVDGESPYVKYFISETYATSGKRVKPFPDNQRELVIATAWRLVEEGQSVLVYCPHRRSVEPFAEEIVKLTKSGILDAKLTVEHEKISTAISIGREWLGINNPILKCLELGVAIHHGALPTPFRKEIENLLRNAVVKVTISSPTLAQGLNLTASSILMFDIKHRRSGEWDTIDTTEFKNVIGRAGRAFVDVKGLVLFPIYEKANEKLPEWNKLKKSTEIQKLKSGFMLLVIELFERIYESLDKPDYNTMLEYILNNTECWNFPNLEKENVEENAQAETVWNEQIDLLDTSILSLLGEEETEIENLSSQLDNVLASSLFRRNLIGNKDLKLYEATILSRARLIWDNSSKLQRRGYFFAGVSLSTGQKLDAIAPKANQLLIDAAGDLLNQEQDSFISSIINIAELIFKIDTFIPDPFPEDWKDILTSWLKGELIKRENKKENTEILQFIENGLVYKLPWGIEAIRVRTKANDDPMGIDEMTIEDNDVQSILPVIETGTMNKNAALLIQSGFSSRTGAIKAVTDTQAEFTNSTELSRWLKSIEHFDSDENWPTPECRKLWISFKKNFKPNENEIWTAKNGHFPVIWYDIDRLPFQSEFLRLHVFENGDSIIMSAGYQKLGKINGTFFHSPIGLFKLRMENDIEFVHYQYFGPNDIDFH